MKYQDNLHIIILAAGKGTRMYSDIPKVLHKVAGKPLLEHVINTAQYLNAEQIHAIIGHEGETVKQQLAHLSVNWVEQAEQLGTGHAVSQVLPKIADESRVLVLYGDTPLVSQQTLERLIEQVSNDALGLLVATVEDPTGLGRVIRDDSGAINAIIEEKDATEVQKAITEIWTGFLIVNAGQLKQWLAKVDNNNAQKEYYLPSILPLAKAEHYDISDVTSHHAGDLLGINNRLQLADAENLYQSMARKQLMQQGTTLLASEQVFIRGELTIGRDTIIDANVIFEGQNIIGDHCSIGPNCSLTNVKLGNHVVIKANSVLDDCTIHDNADVGPFARIRPGTDVADSAHIGSFVEIKKSTIGAGSKVPHLSYVGDATIGKHVNVGAGVITCNYDGVHKHPTIIKDNVFVGSDCQLIAPVTLEENAYVAAGTTVTKDAPSNKLTLSRVKQTSIHYQRKEK